MAVFQITSAFSDATGTLVFVETNCPTPPIINADGTDPEAFGLYTPAPDYEAAGAPDSVSANGMSDTGFILHFDSAPLQFGDSRILFYGATQDINDSDANQLESSVEPYPSVTNNVTAPAAHKGDGAFAMAF